MSACKSATFPGEADRSVADRDLQLLREVVAVSNQVEDFEHALHLALPGIAQRYSCAVGQAFLIPDDPPARLLLCGACYESTPGLLAKVRTPDALDLENAGYLRPIIDRGEPHCTTALEDALGVRGPAAREAGLAWVLGVPVIAGMKTVALLEFFAVQAIEPECGVLDAVAPLGVALGRVLERQRTRSATRRNERLASVGTFAAGIAHELNNPLTSMLMNARLALKHDYPKERLREILDEIAADTERCAKIVKNLVKFARQEPAERSPVNVSELIRRVVAVARRAAERPSVLFEVDILEPLPVVMAEPRAIEQALVSVVSGVLHDGDSRRTVRLQAQETGGKLRICVSAGPSRDLATSQAGATETANDSAGSAYEMAGGIIAEHGGAITIDRRPGGGNRITIELPVAGQSPGRATE